MSSIVITMRRIIRVIYFLSIVNLYQLPVLVYFHGGGFCFGSYSWPKNHVGCLRLAAELPAIVLSFDYRLAPEHCLPAAVEVAAAALLWLPSRMSSDPWLSTDASRHQVFVCGQSSGANLVHHLLIRIGDIVGHDDVKIAGYILLMPPSLSEEPTRLELEAPATALLSREMSDKYFRLGFPVGANKDDPLANPFGPASPSLETVRAVDKHVRAERPNRSSKNWGPPIPQILFRGLEFVETALETVEVGRMLVVAAERDLVRDKNVEYAERMKAMGKDAELVVFAGEEHVFFATKPLSPAADQLL